VIFDTLRADHVTTYGYARNATPSLARLAATGTQFDWAFATSSWTLPSHASLLTGRYPRDHGAEIERFRLPLPTLGAALAADGYRSAAVSANTLAFSRAQGFGGGFGRFDDSFFSVADGLGRTYMTQQIDKRLLLPLGWSDGYFGRRRAEAVNNTALAWIAEDLGRPFFLTLNYFDLHDPYVPPEPWRSRFSSGPEPGGIINSLVGSHGPLTPEQLQREIDAYDGALAYADEQFGRLIDQLDAMGLGSRTLVAVTSDHGESLGLHQLLGHGSSLYAEQIRVPLILRWPGRVPENLRVHEPVSHAGLANTLLELSASPTRLPSAGPAFFGPERLEPMPVLAELAYAPWGGARPTKCGAARALVKSQFHVIAYDDCPAELFDLQADPLEARDLSRTPSYAPVLRELLRLLNELLPSRVSAQDSPVM
jgi:arylsulfatase A-like enzyme